MDTNAKVNKYMNVQSSMNDKIAETALDEARGATWTLAQSASTSDKQRSIAPFLQSYGLAPMDGVSCVATRLWFSLTSQPDFAITPFLRVTKNYPVKRISALYAPEIMAFKNSVSYELIPQLMGSDPEDIARLSEHLLNFTSFVDINCGCPSPTVVGHRAGSGLLEKSQIFYQFTNALKKHIGNKRFSIKMRSGFHTDDEYSELLNISSELKPAQLTLHGRTRADGYKGKARWYLMQKTAQKCDFPIVGSGDIYDHETFKERMSIAPDIEKVIIGRGALRNPWVFQEIRTLKNTTLSINTLCHALGVFALLHEMQCLFSEKLLFLIQENFFSLCCGTDETRWKETYDSICMAIYHKYIAVNELELDRTSFSKIKMLWNYMRSSHPDEFMDPLLLRAKSFADFINILRQISRVTDPHSISLKYNSCWDWIYSGEKRGTGSH